MSESCRPYSLEKLWRSLKQRRTRIDKTQEIIQEAQEQQEMHGRQKVQEEKMCDTSPPPPYTESSSDDGSKNPAPERKSTPYPLLTKYAFAVENSQSYCDGYFLLCLMEIMAVTFPTDFVRLKAILAESSSRWAASSHLQEPSSLFHIARRPIVAELTALVRNLEEALASNRWLFVDKKEKELVRIWVLLPVQARGINLDYVLEVLGRYECTESCGVEGYRIAKKTLVDYWMPLSPNDQPKDELIMLDLGDTLASHTLLLHSLRLGKKMDLVFEESINTFWKDKGLEGLQTSKKLQEESLSSGEKCCWWPLSDGYMNLAKVLRGLGPSSVMDDPFEPSRTRLREGRKVFRA